MVPSVNGNEKTSETSSPYEKPKKKHRSLRTQHKDARSVWLKNARDFHPSPKADRDGFAFYDIIAELKRVL
jgi:hypothetical protein